jgi:hypothetical protein
LRPFVVSKNVGAALGIAQVRQTQGSDALDLEKLSGFDAAVAGDDRRRCLSLLIIVVDTRLSYKDRDRPGPIRGLGGYRSLSWASPFKRESHAVEQ